MKMVFSIVLLLMFWLYSSGQELLLDENYKNQRRIFYSTAIGSYAISITSLSYVWYKDYEKSSFHFFDDSKEWLQMDKAGHIYSSWHITSFFYRGFMYSQYSKELSLKYSFISSNIAMASIEVFDGFSKKWGASLSDIAANLLGSSAFYLQEKYATNPFVFMKFSFSQSPYYHFYPKALGNNYLQNIIKDYNGQSYWLSFPVNNIINKAPKWLCLSLGYSANGMLGGMDNIYNDNWAKKPDYDIKRYRQYLFSIDLDLSAIKSNNKFIKQSLNLFNILKIPFPTIELSNNKLKAHYIYL